MNHFCDLLSDVPGIRPIRPAPGSIRPRAAGIFRCFDMCRRSWAAVTDAFQPGGDGGRRHLPAGLQQAAAPAPTVYDDGCLRRRATYAAGKPAPSASAERFPEKLPIAEAANRYTFEVPWFKRYRPEIIAQHADAYKRSSGIMRPCWPTTWGRRRHRRVFQLLQRTESVASGRSEVWDEDFAELLTRYRVQLHKACSDI